MYTLLLLRGSLSEKQESFQKIPFSILPPAKAGTQGLKARFFSRGFTIHLPPPQGGEKKGAAKGEEEEEEA